MTNVERKTTLLSRSPVFSPALGDVLTLSFVVSLNALSKRLLDQRLWRVVLRFSHHAPIHFFGKSREGFAHPAINWPMNNSPSPDNHEPFVDLFTRNEQELQTIERSLVPSWHDSDAFRTTFYQIQP